MDSKRLAQIVIEERYSRKEVRSRVKKYLVQDSEFYLKIVEACHYINQWLEQPKDYLSKELRLKQFQSSDVSVEDVVLDIVVTTMVNGYSNIQSICGQVAPSLGYEDIYDGVTTVAEMITIIGIHTDLIDIIMPEDSELDSITIEANYQLSEELLQYIAHTKYLPPMIVKPVTVFNNYDFDYYTVESSKILGSNNHHNMPIALDVLNILNSVQLELDIYTLQNKEVPNHELDTPKKREQFDRMVIASEAVYEELLKEADGKFYLTWKYDKRGRIYSQGYHVNIQSTDYKKSLINLAKKEQIQLF